VSGDINKMITAQKILDTAYYYKFCECCESVVLFDSVFCPICGGYRFDEGLTKTVAAIKELAKKNKTKIISELDLDLDNLI